MKIIKEHQVLAWLLRGSVGLGAAIGAGCAVELEPGFSELGEDDEVDLRADGCGAQMEKVSIEKSCSYFGQALSPIKEVNNKVENLSVNAVCKSDEQLKCYYTYTGCVMRTNTPPGCAKVPPGVVNPTCADLPDPSIQLEWVFDLPAGDTTCDPPVPLGPEAKCRQLLKTKINGQDDVIASLHAKCDAQKDAKPITFQCCEMKKPKEGTTGGEAGGETTAGCESETDWASSGAWTTTGESGWTATSFGDSMTTVTATSFGDPMSTTSFGDPMSTTSVGDPMSTTSVGDPMSTTSVGDPMLINNY